MFLLQICAADLFRGIPGSCWAAWCPVPSLLADRGSSGAHPSAWEPVSGPGQGHHTWWVRRGSSSWDCAFPGVSLRSSCPGAGRRGSRATYLRCTPAWNGSTGCSEPSCQFCASLVPGGVCLRGAATSPGELGSVQAWKFCSANEYVGGLHSERNSIYFVQGRIPLHSEQIYYKSVLP